MDLTALSQTTRKAIILVGLGVIALIIIRIALVVVIALIRNLSPATPPVANQLFGTLPAVKFNQPTLSSSKFTYNLETVDSKLPNMPTLATVYQLRTPPTLFLSLDQAKKRAAEFGFNQEPTAQSANIYQWVDTDLPGYTFTLDVISGDFHLKSDPTKSTFLNDNKLTIDSNEAVSQARSYLKNHSSLTPLFEKGTTGVKFLNITTSQTSEVGSPAAANAFRVDIYPASIDDKFTVLNQTPMTGIISLTMLHNKDGVAQPFEINYKQLEIDTDTKGTYNIITSNQAWDGLNNGQAVVIKSSTTSGQIAISNISLGYFVEEKSKFLKPVYVFEGTSSPDKTETDFTAVLPAIGTPNKSQ